MSPADQPARPDPRIIIHHLSDLHYEDTPQGKNKKNVLVKYRGYLENLPEERRPDIIVITGDLTAFGKKQDLKTVATILRNWFPKWENSLKQHVIVVPGPHDVNWEGEELPALDAFDESLSDFALPTQNVSPAVRVKLEESGAEFIAYPMDTCYSPIDLKPQLKREFDAYGKRYGAFVKRRAKVKFGKRGLSLWEWIRGRGKSGGDEARTKALEDLSARFLNLTEGTPPVALDSGRVRLEEVARFKRWTEALVLTEAAAKEAALKEAALKEAEAKEAEAKKAVASQSSQNARSSQDAESPKQPSMPPEPLKLLVTHHPLAIQPDQENKDESGASRDALQSFEDVATAARTAGFHLALHGHIHKPQVLSDLSIMEGLGAQHPMRQIGAASLGDTGLFNEITATYRTEKGKGVWRLELRLINVLTEDKPGSTGKDATSANGIADADSKDKKDGQDGGGGGDGEDNGRTSFVLLNPAESADNKVERLTQDVAVRKEFDNRMRIAMRRYSDQVYQWQNENRPEKLAGFTLPQDTMQFLESIIRDVIFARFQVRVQLLLKSVENSSPVPTLVPKYLTPAILEGPESLVYPASVAAWSLILGRSLTFPQLLSETTTQPDLDWLQRSGKIQGLCDVLTSLRDSAREKSYPANQLLPRYDELHTTLTTIGSGGKGEIRGAQMYQQAPNGSPPGSYPYFICIPYPQRPPGGALPTLPEVAVLDIGVLPMPHPVGQRQPAPEVTPFTAERLAMLNTVTELIGLVLTTSSAIGKPPGVWDNRPRVGR